jgi:hypothetical protein
MGWPHGVGLRLTQGGSGEFGYGTRAGGALALGELFIGPTCARHKSHKLTVLLLSTSVPEMQPHYRRKLLRLKYRNGLFQNMARARSPLKSL